MKQKKINEKLKKMNFEEVIYKRRTIRRFKQDPIPLETLKKLVDYDKYTLEGAIRKLNERE